MNERIKLIFAVLASLLIVGLLLMPGQQQNFNASKPLSTDRGDSGLMGLDRWLQHSGISTLSFRTRYAQLKDHEALPATGNLLITSLPHATAVQETELNDLLLWLEQGNSVLILAAKQDWPVWAYQSLFGFNQQGIDDFIEPLGFKLAEPELEPEADPDADTLVDVAGEEAGTEQQNEEESDGDQEFDIEALMSMGKRKPQELSPAIEHPRLQGVKAVSVLSMAKPRDVELQMTERWALAFPLLQHADSGYDVLWEALYGSGKVWLSAYPDLFGNISLGERDNARLLENILEAALRAEGHVVFDDYHFGLSDLYDPAAFIRDKRLHATLMFIVLFWLVYVFGSGGYLAPLRKTNRQPQEVDFVQALAGLCARRIEPQVVASGLFVHFFNDVRRRHRHRENGRVAWELLARHSQVGSRDVQALKRLWENNQQGKKINLNQLAQLIQKIRNAL